MSGIISNGLSALLAAQRAIQTTSNNVANANTDGYVRQRVNLAERPSSATGNIQIGQGVNIASVDRLYDQLLGTQLQESTSSTSRADAFNGLAIRMDKLLGNPDLSIGTSVQKFFTQVDVVNRDPTSIANRQQLLLQGQDLVGRFQELNGQLSSLGQEVNSRLQQSITGINQIAQSIAGLNERIVSSGLNPPPDLLDQRDLLVGKLADQIDVSTVRQADGSLSVFVGAGQGLVVGSNASKLGLVADPLDSASMQLGIGTGGQLQNISGKVTGGTVGGLLAFRTDVLEPAQRDLGRLATGLAYAFNSQHSQGMDLNGALGGNFFAIAAPATAAASTNTGSAGVTAAVSNAGAIEARDYELRFDGATWTLYDRATTGQVAMTGSGTAASPFQAGGLSMTVSGTAQAGDRFLVRPVTGATSGMAVLVTDPARLAVAAPLTTSASLANASGASIGPATVGDVTDPKLLATGTIEFLSPTQYQVWTGGGADLTGPLTYTSGSDISFAGWTVQVSGTPLAGDRFTIRPAGASSGDNTNGLGLSAIQQKGFFSNGQQSLTDVASDIVASVGAVAARSGNDLIAQKSISDQAQLDFESVSGVNLDEEAANLLRYQQAYQAATKVIAVSDELFRTLLGMVGR